jgi:hypothetical protein
MASKSLQLFVMPNELKQVYVGEDVDVVASVETRGTEEFEVVLALDQEVLTEISGQSNPTSIAASKGEVRWVLHARKKTEKPVRVEVEARTAGLLQRAQFEIEVI